MLIPLRAAQRYIMRLPVRAIVTGRLKRDHLWASLVPFEIGGLGSGDFCLIYFVFSAFEPVGALVPFELFSAFFRR